MNLRSRRSSRAAVAIVKHDDEKQALRQALELLPLEGFIEPEHTVAITPNWVQAKGPETGIVSGPETFQALVQWVKGFGPKRIVVACGSAGAGTSDALEAAGFKPVIQKENLEFVDLNYGPYVDLSLEHDYPSVTPVNRLEEEADVLISLTPLKAHAEAVMTASIKNIALSWPPAEIHGFPKTQRGIHEKLHEFIAAMSKAMIIDLAIVSTNPAMIGTGPAAGKPARAGLLLAGTDPVSTDVVAARLLGFMPQAVHYLYRAIEMGVGEGDLKKIDLRGIPLNEAEAIFSQAAYGYRIALDEGSLQPLQAK